MNKINMKIRKISSGFSLIELMIAVAVVGILASIAYPSYQAHVTKTNRNEAMQRIMELAQFEERFFTETGAYTASIPFNGAGTHYSYVSTVSPTTFVITATPGAIQAAKDAACGALSVDHRGVKCITNGTKCSDSASASVRKDVEDCW